ncbi:MAG TPA: hypothetical protein ENH81_06745 [Thermococcus sp.]|nr:hypothetical protein [Thermococcus sp.]
MGLIQEIFAPKYVLQGEDFPLILRWDIDTIPEVIEISYNPKSVEIEEIYNIASLGLLVIPASKSLKIVRINSVSINGYLGAKFRTKKTSEIIGKVHVTIRIKTSKGIELRTLTVHTIKPVIKVLKSPNIIQISCNNEYPKVKDKFKLKNIGQGTAILDFSVGDSSPEVSVGPPSRLGEYIASVFNSMKDNFRRVAKEYPQYSEPLHLAISIIEYLESGQEIDDELIRKIKKFETCMENLSHDSKFMDEYMSSILAAYFSNIQILTDVETFIVYLNSVYQGKILLINPLKVIHFPDKGEYELNLEIHLTDLLYSRYAPIPLGKVKILVDKECEVPIYKLFEFIGEGEENDRPNSQ